MKTTLEVNCAFCRKPLVMHNVERDGLAMFDMAKVQTMILCVKCYDYRRVSRILISKIHRAAVVLEQARRYPKTAKAENTKKARESVPDLLRSFMECTGGFYRVPVVWEEGYAEAFLGAPMLYGRLLKDITANIESDASAQSAAVADPG